MFRNTATLGWVLTLTTACGSGADNASNTDANGGSDGGPNPVPCAGAPTATYEPTATYVEPAFTPTVTVSNADDSGPGSLRNAVAAGGSIGFDASMSGKVITLRRPIQIETSVDIHGGTSRVTIDGANASAIFRFNGDAPTRLSFFALRLVNGKSDGSGAAISINGGNVEVEIGGVWFESNTASEGGAVRIGYGIESRAFVHDSTFLSNDGSIGDNGFSGGGISVSGAQLTIARCRFEGNKGSTSGAVYAIHANPSIEDSVFISNQSSRDNGGSGAFFVDGGGPGDYGNGIKTPGQIIIRRSLFWKNRGAGDDGGAAELYAYPPDVVTIQDSVFRENTANPGRAGALFIHADNAVTIERTAFVNNRAQGGPGGAIWADGDAVYTFENVLFSGNVTTSDLGGALRMNVSEKSKINITSSTLVDNEAQDGNGAMWIGGMRDVNVRNSIFSNNTGSAGSQQINFPVSDDGGNIEWPDTGANVRSLGSPLVADPLLGGLLEGRMLVRPLGPASPAKDRAVAPSPVLDQRGSRRDATPDIGSSELPGMCE